MMDEMDAGEREMMLRALRDYSDHCLPPKLTPECPFSVMREPDLWTCEEQCMDVLGRYGAPRQVREISLGSDTIALVPLRPRARRRQRPSEKPFDAAEIYMVDSELEAISEWRMSALIHAVMKLAESPPPPDDPGRVSRCKQMNEVLAELARRGINVPNTIEPAIRLAIPRAILSEVLHMDDKPPGASTDDAQYIATWSEAISEVYNPHQTTTGAPTRQMLGTLIDALRRWSRDARIDDVKNWIPPTVPLTNPEPVPPVDFDPEGRWLYDRFCATYVQEWHSDSLCREWKYIHGELEPPCAHREMREREVQEDELSRVMADRLAQNYRDRLSLAHELKPAAIRYLEEGQLEKAATLFDAAVHQDGSDAEALNNLGFCVLPSDPERAIEHFVRASELGWSESVISECNRILAIALAGRLTVALDFAQALLYQHREAGLRGNCYMWDPKILLLEGRPVLSEYDDLVSYVELIVTTVDILLQRRGSAQKRASS